MILYLTWSLYGLLAFCPALSNLFFSGMWFPTLLGRVELFEAFPATVIQQGMEAVTISWNRSKTQHWLVKVLSTEISQPCLKCFWQNEVLTNCCVVIELAKTKTTYGHFSTLRRPFFFVPADKNSIHWLLFKTSLLLQRPLSSVSKVAVVDRVSTVMTFFYNCLLKSRKWNPEK